MAKYNAISSRRVPFLPERHIEQEAAVLVAEYGQAHGAVTEPPVPIDEMIELYLIRSSTRPSSGATASRWHTRPAIGGCTDICSRRGPTSFPAHPTKAYLVSWMPRILSLRNSGKKRGHH